MNVAEILSAWIQSVIRATQPWRSIKDIDHGALGFNEISNGLKENRVCTFLIDLKPEFCRFYRVCGLSVTIRLNPINSSSLSSRT